MSNDTENKCTCENKYIINRYVNRGLEGDSNYREIYDNLKKESIYIEEFMPNLYYNNGYDEEYLCTKCGKNGYSRDFKNFL